jgi:prepilin-type N-terminal cleavage/methylation domain-containing protein
MNKSFTLIEILVVIVVIGVLSAFILVGMSLITSKANIAKSQAFLNSMDNSLLIGRVSQWKLDQITTSGTSTTSDAWGSNTGTLYDGASTACVFGSSPACPQPVTSGCVSGSCLSFDGTNDYVVCGNLTKYSQFTIAIWINGLRGQNVGGIVHSGGGSFYRWGISIESAQIRSLISNETAIDSWYIQNYDEANYPSGWHLITLTNDGILREYYKDGVFINQHTNTITNSGSVQTIRIGKGGGADASYFNGLMDDVRIYNQALPISQIQQNYYVGINKLFKNNGITLNEFNQKIGELKNSILADVDN